MTDQPSHSSASGPDDSPPHEPAPTGSASSTSRRVTVIGAAVLAIAAIVAVSAISGSDDGPDDAADDAQVATSDAEVDGDGTADDNDGADATDPASDGEPGDTTDGTGDAGGNADSGGGQASDSPMNGADNGADAPDNGPDTEGPQGSGDTDGGTTPGGAPDGPNGARQDGPGSQERPADFEDVVGDAIDVAFDRFNAVPVSADEAAANATSMNIHETQLALARVTGVDATTATIVIHTDLEPGAVLLENDTAQGAAGICNVVIGDTHAWREWIDVIEVHATNGDVLASCVHQVAR